jgi:hypothetical protein
LDVDPALTLTIVWKSFTILNHVEMVAEAKNEVRKSTLNGSWRNIWPSVVLEKNLVVPSIEVQYQHDINSVGGEGFEEMTVEEIKEKNSLSINKKYMKNCVFFRLSEPNPIFCMNFMSRFTRFRFARYLSSP